MHPCQQSAAILNQPDLITFINQQVGRMPTCPTTTSDQDKHPEPPPFSLAGKQAADALKSGTDVEQSLFSILMLISGRIERPALVNATG